MSTRSDVREIRRWPLPAAAWLVLQALSACATGTMPHREGTSAAAPGSSSAEAAAPAAPAAPAPAAPEPAAPAPAAPEPAAPSPPTPEEPPASSVSAKAASVDGASGARAGAGKALPPCVPARRTKHVKKHHSPKTVPPEAPAAPVAPPAPAEAMVDARVGELGTPLASILGKEVKSPKGEDLGRVVDVLADADGHVRVAIIDFGGFLGVGTRRIAVDWPLLHFNPTGDKSLILSMTRQKLQSAPEYKESNSPRVLMPPAAPDATDNGQTKH